jgi:hypothetical protein
MVSVNPIYYVGFSTATLVASLILFQGFNTTDATNTLSLLAGFIVTFLGVHLLNISRISDPVDPQPGRSALEAGLLNPRLSLQGRLSSDGWGGAEGRDEVTPRSASHGRRSSTYRAQSTTLFNAFEGGDGLPEESVALQELREEGEGEGGDDDDDRADERTHLRSATTGRDRHYESRSQNHSPNGISLRDTQREPPI